METLCICIFAEYRRHGCPLRRSASSQDLLCNFSQALVACYYIVVVVKPLISVKHRFLSWTARPIAHTADGSFSAVLLHCLLVGVVHSVAFSLIYISASVHGGREPFTVKTFACAEQLFVFRVTLPCSHIIRVVTDDGIAFKLVAINTYRLLYNEILCSVHVCCTDCKFR